jgi:hypothetical protein
MKKPISAQKKALKVPLRKHSEPTVVRKILARALELEEAENGKPGALETPSLTTKDDTGLPSETWAVLLAKREAEEAARSLRRTTSFGTGHGMVQAPVTSVPRKNRVISALYETDDSDVAAGPPAAETTGQSGVLGRKRKTHLVAEPHGAILDNGGPSSDISGSDSATTAKRNESSLEEELQAVDHTMLGYRGERFKVSLLLN